MKPIIGITVECKHDPADARTRGKIELNWNYGQAISDAGGVPVILPPMADMGAVVDLIDGWLIPGGLDIDAKNFGEENHPACELQDPSRFASEKALMEATPPEMPILGICYGCQFLNVIRGGTLLQHLPDVAGAAVHTDGPLQTYQIKDGSKLNKLAGRAAVDGKSYHHQAIKQPGRNLEIVATSNDGIIEAVEASDRPWLIGVQWHPERTLESPESTRIFAEFIAAARAYSERKRTTR